MDCRELEDRLEALLDGELGEDERQRCARHLERCNECRELLEPLGPVVAPPPDLVDSVLARTSGPACGRAEELLCGWLDRELAGGDRELMSAHLDSCEGCRSLAAAMTRLARELPELAELRPEPGFVEAVLQATLPPRVRLHRWWAAAWPRWVCRPRFASEAAFVGTLALVLLFATPGSPLAAVPDQALELARADPAEGIESRLAAPMAALEEGLATRIREPLGAGFARSEAQVREWAAAASASGRALASEAGDWLGTTRAWLASLMTSADEQASASDDDPAIQNQEKP